MCFIVNEKHMLVLVAVKPLALAARTPNWAYNRFVCKSLKSAFKFRIRAKENEKIKFNLSHI